VKIISVLCMAVVILWSPAQEQVILRERLITIDRGIRNAQTELNSIIILMLLLEQLKQKDVPI